MKTIDIVIPVYNEEKVIHHFHETLMKVLVTLEVRYRFHLIYALDKSTDATLDRLKQIAQNQQNVSVLLFSRRYGHQMSLVAGMDQCDSDALIMMDSDLEHPPELIPKLLEAWEKGYHVVNTVRTYASNVSFFKSFTSKLFYSILKKITSFGMISNSPDFRLLSRRVYQEFQNHIREQNQFLRGLVSWVGFNQTVVEFSSSTRTAGTSKYNVEQLFRFAIQGIFSFSKVPLRAFSIFGFFLSCISLLYGSFSILYYFLVENIPVGWTSLVVLITFLMGLQFVFLGLLGEYIGFIFDEVKHRPLYIIEEIYGKRKPTKNDSKR